MALGFAAALLSYLLKSIRYLLLLGKRAGIRRVVGISIAQNVIAQLVPMRAGDVGFVVLVRKTGVASIGYGLASLLIVRLVDLFVLWGMYVVSLGMLSLDHPAYRWSAILLGIVLTAGILTAAAVVFGVERLSPRFEKLWQRLGLFRFRAVRKGWRELVDGARNLGLVLKPGLLVSLVLVSVAVWAVSCVWNYFAWMAVRVSLSAAEAVFMTSFSYLVTLLPVFLFGGIGTGDMLYAGVLEAFGKPGNVPAFTLCNRVLSTLYQALFAVLFYFVMMGQWRAAENPERRLEADR